MKKVVDRVLGRRDDAQMTSIERVAAFFKREFGVDEIDQAWVKQFLESEPGRRDPEQHLRVRTSSAQRMYHQLMGREPDDPKELVPLVLHDPLHVATTRLARQPEARRILRKSLNYGLANLPPRQPVLFDHVSKTGGSTINAALNYLYPMHTISDRLDLLNRLNADEIDWSEWARWPVICGHVGRRHYDKIPDIKHRKICTVIRDPVSRTRSVYTWLRFNIPPTHRWYHQPVIEAARNMDFAEFIRCDIAQERFCDKQFEVISSDDSGPSDQSAADRIAELLGVFDLVGVTDQLAEFFDELLRLMDVTTTVPSHELMRLVYRNKSLGSVDITPQDAAHIRAINPLDTELYEQAKQLVEARGAAPSERAA